MGVHLTAADVRVRSDGSVNVNPLKHLLVRTITAESLPGLVASVVTGQGTALLACGYRDLGRSEPIGFDEPLRLSSMMKPFTATALLQLVRAGDLDLDAPVSRWLRSIDVDQRVTIRHCLTHSSGLNRPGYFHVDEADAMPSLADFYAADQLRCDFVPGTAAAYSNHGYAVLGQLIADVSGATFDEHLTKTVLKPIGAGVRLSEDTRGGLGFEFDDEGALSVAPNYLPVLTPASGGWSTIDDLVRLPLEWCDGDSAVLGGRKFIDPTANLALPGLPARAFGWAMTSIDADVVLSHAGGWPGYSGNIACCPAKGIAVAAMINMSAEVRGDLGASMIKAIA